MTTVEKLNYLISIKSDIKTAIENKGVDMTGVSFLGYAGKIGEIVSGVGYTDRDIIEARYIYDISNSASFVYSSAFEYKSVQTVDLPNCIYVGNKAFFYCTNLTTVNLPACTALHEYAFRSCNNLSYISIPNVTGLSGYCFENCTALETISLPKCSYLSRYAFWSCSNLNTIYMGTELSTVATMVQSNALLDCSALQSIYVPASLVDAYKSAENWSYYSSIIYPIGPYYIKWTPSSAEGQFNVDGTTYDLSTFGGLYNWSTGIINRDAFRKNYSIQSIETNATSIGSYAFQSCYSLSQVSLPICSYIWGNVFEKCSSLSQVNLPMCSYIGTGALGYCKSLSQVRIPVCSYIGVTAFAYCISLSQLSLPVCSIIRDYAFIGCSSLNMITIRYSGVCSLGLNAFESTKITSSTGSIYVPASLVDAYKSAENWSVYSNIIYPIN